MFAMLAASLFPIMHNLFLLSQLWYDEHTSLTEWNISTVFAITMNISAICNRSFGQSIVLDGARAREREMNYFRLEQHINIKTNQNMDACVIANLFQFKVMPSDRQTSVIQILSSKAQRFYQVNFKCSKQERWS